MVYYIDWLEFVRKHLTEEFKIKSQKLIGYYDRDGYEIYFEDWFYPLHQYQKESFSEPIPVEIVAAKLVAELNFLAEKWEVPPENIETLCCDEIQPEWEGKVE
jgi:hypothetical protein